MDDWPDGPADPEAARERYLRDLRENRRVLREVLRADMPAAHAGVGAVILVSVVTGCFAGPWFGALVALGFVALFALALTVLRLRGRHGRDAARRAYLLTFGWGNWL